MPNPGVANPRVAERAPWWSTKRGVAGVCSLLERPTDSCHFPCTSDTLVRPQNSLARKALTATKGVSKRGLGTCQSFCFLFLHVSIGVLEAHAHPDII